MDTFIRFERPSALFFAALLGCGMMFMDSLASAGPCSPPLRPENGLRSRSSTIACWRSLLTSSCASETPASALSIDPRFVEMVPCSSDSVVNWRLTSASSCRLLRLGLEPLASSQSSLADILIVKWEDQEREKNIVKTEASYFFFGIELIQSFCSSSVFSICASAILVRYHFPKKRWNRCIFVLHQLSKLPPLIVFLRLETLTSHISLSSTALRATEANRVCSWLSRARCADWRWQRPNRLGSCRILQEDDFQSRRCNLPCCWRGWSTR